jgi:hypothetical protein
MLLATFRCRAAIARRSQWRLSRIAKVAMAAVLKDQSGDFRVAMDDPYDLILRMFALAVTAIMLVAGGLYLVTRPEQPETYAPPASIVTSSIQ